MINEKHRDKYTESAGREMVFHGAQMVEMGGGEVRLDLSAPRPYLEGVHAALGEVLAGVIPDEMREA